MRQIAHSRICQLSLNTFWWIGQLVLNWLDEIQCINFKTSFDNISVRQYSIRFENTHTIYCLLFLYDLSHPVRQKCQCQQCKKPFTCFFLLLLMFLRTFYKGLFVVVAIICLEKHLTVWYSNHVFFLSVLVTEQ